MQIPLSSKISLMQILKQWALQDLRVYLAKIIPFFAEKVSGSQVGSGVSLAEGSLAIHCVIPAFTEKHSKGCQIAFSYKVLDPMASCSSFCSHLALQVTLENIKHVLFLWMFHPLDLSWGKLPTLSHQLKSFTWNADDDSEQPMSLLLVKQPHPAEALLLRTQTPAQAKSHALPSPLVPPQQNWLPGGGQMCMMEQES